MNQTTKILNLLQSGRWICVNEMLALYCVDYRRRLVDLKELGYTLESRKCHQHLHKGGSKEWRLLTKNTPPAQDYDLLPMTKKIRDWNKQFYTEPSKQKQLF